MYHKKSGKSSKIKPTNKEIEMSAEEWMKINSRFFGEENVETFDPEDNYGLDDDITPELTFD